MVIAGAMFNFWFSVISVTLILPLAHNYVGKKISFDIKYKEDTRDAVCLFWNIELVKSTNNRSKLSF